MRLSRNLQITQLSASSLAAYGIRWHQWLAWQQHFFLSIFSVSCYGISPKTKFVNCLRKKTPKTHAKRTYKVAQQVFHEYLLEKGIAEPTEKSEIARVLKRF